MPNLGPMEILVVLIVALIVLGPKRLPEAGRQVGRAVAEVRRWSNTMQAEVKAVLDDGEEAPPPVPWNPPGGTRLEPPTGLPSETVPIEAPGDASDLPGAAAPVETLDGAAEMPGDVAHPPGDATQLPGDTSTR